jgi:hypothetical protein
LLEEQQLWNSYDNAEIYEFLTGEKDTIPEFQLDWILPEDPAICWPAQFQPSNTHLIEDKPVPTPPATSSLFLHLNQHQSTSR